MNDAFPFALADGTKRGSVASEGIILDLNKDEHILVQRNDIDLALLGMKILFEDLIALLDKMFFRDFLAPDTLLIAFEPHNAGIAAILLPPRP